MVRPDQSQDTAAVARRLQPCQLVVCAWWASFGVMFLPKQTLEEHGKCLRLLMLVWAGTVATTPCVKIRKATPKHVGGSPGGQLLASDNGQRSGRKNHDRMKTDKIPLLKTMPIGHGVKCEQEDLKSRGMAWSNSNKGIGPLQVTREACAQGPDHDEPVNIAHGTPNTPRT